MRILLVADFAHTGGTRTYFEMLVSLFFSRGYSVYALVQETYLDSTFVDFARMHDLKWAAFPERENSQWLPNHAPLFELPILARFFMEFKPDVVFVSSGHPGQWLSPFMLCWPAIHVHHNCVPPLSLQNTEHMQTLFSHATAKHTIVTVSHFAATCMRDGWGVVPQVVPNPTRFSKSAKGAKRAHGKQILTVGHVIGYKNPDAWLQVALNVIERHPDASFLWVGDGALLENARAICKDIPQVFFAGPSEDIEPIYASSSILFHPSLLENFPLAILEGMSFALPCVASNVGGIPELLHHGETGFMFDPQDIQGMVDSLCALLEDSTFADVIGKAGQKVVQDNYMLEHWEQKIIDLLEQVARS